MDILDIVDLSKPAHVIIRSLMEWAVKSAGFGEAFFLEYDPTRDTLVVVTSTVPPQEGVVSGMRISGFSRGFLLSLPVASAVLFQQPPAELLSILPTPKARANCASCLIMTIPLYGKESRWIVIFTSRVRTFPDEETVRAFSWIAKALKLSVEAQSVKAEVERVLARERLLSTKINELQQGLKSIAKKYREAAWLLNLVWTSYVGAIRSRITNVLSLSELLYLRSKDRKEKELVFRIHENTKKVYLELESTRLLALSAVGKLTASPEYTDVSELLAETFSFFSLEEERGKISFEIGCPGKRAYARVDRFIFGISVKNLVEKCLELSSGKVHVRADCWPVGASAALKITISGINAYPEKVLKFALPEALSVQGITAETEGTSNQVSVTFKLERAGGGSH